MAAMQLARLDGTALRSSPPGRRRHGHRPAGAARAGSACGCTSRGATSPSASAFTFVDDGAERTITVMGDRLVPAAARRPAVGRAATTSMPSTSPAATPGRAAGPRRHGADRHAARRARAARERVALDALILSVDDVDRGAPRPATSNRRRGSSSRPQGAQGGALDRARGTHRPLPVRRRCRARSADSYGAGDCFAAASRSRWARAGDRRGVAVGASCGAKAMTRAGGWGPEPQS